jgi:hypothetical protein
MTKQEFAQELMLRTLILKGQDLNMKEVSTSTRTHVSRMAATATTLADVIEKDHPGFFTGPSDVACALPKS